MVRKRHLSDLVIVASSTSKKCAVMVQNQSLTDNLSCDLFETSNAWEMMGCTGNWRIYEILNGPNYYRNKEHFINAIGDWLTDQKFTWVAYILETGDVGFQLLDREDIL